MRAIKYGLKLDTYLQGVIMILGIASLIVMFMNQRHGWIAMIMFCFLGLYQTISGVIWALALKDKKRKRHLLHMIIYWLCYPVLFGLTALLASILDKFFDHNSLIVFCPMALYIFGVPIYLAIRYFKITIGDMARVGTLHPKFWNQ